MRRAYIALAAILLLLGVGLYFSSSAEKVIDVSKFEYYAVVPVNGKGGYVIDLYESDILPGPRIIYLDTIHVGIIKDGRMVEVPSAVFRVYKPIPGEFDPGVFPHLAFYIPDDNVTTAYIFFNPSDGEPNPKDFRNVFRVKVVASRGGVLAARYDPDVNKVMFLSGRPLAWCQADRSHIYEDQVLKVGYLDPVTLEVEESVTYDPDPGNNSADASTYYSGYFAYPWAVYYESGVPIYYFSASFIYCTGCPYSNDCWDGTYQEHEEFRTIARVPGGAFRLPTSGHEFVYASPDGYVYLVKGNAIEQYDKDYAGYNTTITLPDGCSVDSLVCTGGYCYVAVIGNDCLEPGYNYYIVGFNESRPSGYDVLLRAKYENVRYHHRIVGQSYRDGYLSLDGMKVIFGGPVERWIGVAALHAKFDWLGPGYILEGIDYRDNVLYIPLPRPAYLEAVGSDGEYFYSVYGFRGIYRWTYDISPITGTFELREINTVTLLVEERNQLYSHVFLRGLVSPALDGNLTVAVDGVPVYTTEISGSFDINFPVEGIEPGTDHNISVYFLAPDLTSAYYEYNAYFAPVLPIYIPDELNAEANSPLTLSISLYANPDDNVYVYALVGDDNYEMNVSCTELSPSLVECAATSVLTFPELNVYEVRYLAVVDHAGSVYELNVGSTTVYVTERVEEEQPPVSFSPGTGAGAPSGASPAPAAELPTEEVQPPVQPASPAPSVSPAYALVAVVALALLVYFITRR